MKTIGERAQEFRISKEWNTARMAKEVGTSRQSIENLEAAGNRQPRYIARLAKAMGVTVDDLVGGHGNADMLAPSPRLSATGSESHQAVAPVQQAQSAINAVAQNAPMDHLIAQIQDPVVRAEVVRDVANIILAAIRKQQANPLLVAPQTPETPGAEHLAPSKYP